MASTRSVRDRSLTDTSAISAVELFKDLPEAGIDAVRKKSKVCEFKAGHVFFQPGQTGQVLFLLEQGHVQTFRTSGRKKLIIEDLTTPEVFGEMGCVGQGIYHCAAQATESSRIRTISRSDLEELLDEYPQLTRRLLDLVSKRFVRLLLDLEATSFQHLIPRLARLLLENAKDGWVCNLTHREMAEHLRVYRESATTALGELKRAGILAIERRQIHILDRARLERASRE